MLAETGARGVLGRVVGVKTQQAEIDSPLDDLVVDGALADGTATQLDLQITTTLSFTESDAKWCDVLPRAWATYRQTGFDAATRRIGIAVSQTTTKLERSIQPLLARARHAADTKQYRKRLAVAKGANDDQREFQRVLDKLVRNADPKATDDEIVDFLRCVTIIAFDLDQGDASRDVLASIDQLTPIAGGAAEARTVWNTLNTLASQIIPSGGGADRAAVAAALLIEGHSVGADRRHADLIVAIDSESRAAAASIRDTIGGASVPRDALQSAIVDAVAEARLVRIVGEHGTGKSAMLKRFALDEPAGAPILLLRDLRIGGGGWTAHAARFGALTPLPTLLREFRLAGSRTLYIDGIDKILDPAVHVTINDLLTTIAGAPGLEDWRIVMTIREENTQRVDGWLDPDALSRLPSKSVRVEAFDEDESAEAATVLPLLRPLLSDPQNYDKVLRRPFFLDALSRLPLPAEGEVRSEVDLVQLWWQHGGADAAEFAPAQGRRNLLLRLGERLLANPGLPLPIHELDPVPLDELRRAGVLRDVAFGSSVAFAHDIYEEWSLHRVLSLRQADMAQALREGGQDLQLARPLQLLATDILERPSGAPEWIALLAVLDAKDLRATWSRVVLTAPVRSVRSDAMLSQIEQELMRDGGRLLGRLMLAVRTTEVVRDLRFLDDTVVPDLTHEQREQFASEAASPQLLTWLRLVSWLVPRLDEVPEEQLGELYPLLDAWVTSVPAFAGLHLHVPAIADWARDQLGSEDTSEEKEQSWGNYLRRPYTDSARSLFLKTAGSAPEAVRGYLAAISKSALRRVRKKIVEGSAAIIGASPADLASFIKRAFLLDHDRDRSGSRYASRQRSEELGFDDDKAFYPASPIRPPFLHMLRSRPDEGLDLIGHICNHAIAGWRRSQTGPGHTPLPVTVDPGAGPWDFWGDDSTYSWFRGGSHVNILDTALMALDAWAHERLKKGDDIDTLCRRIASNNECNAVLGICAGLAVTDFNAALASTVAFALTTHPALWAWDISRQARDLGSHTNEIAYFGPARHLARGLHAHNRLPHRKRSIRDLSAAFPLSGVKQDYVDAIATFLDRVPFGTEEVRDDDDRAEALRHYFETFRQQADPANLRVELRGDQIAAWIEPPYASEEKHQSFVAEQGDLNRVLALYLWATKAVETGRPDNTFTLQKAFEEMVALDDPELLNEGQSVHDLRRHHQQSAVAATAAVLARHGDLALWSKAEGAVTDVINRAATMVETKDPFFSRSAHLAGHPPAMAAHGYAALVRRDAGNVDHRAALFQLAVDPIEKVVEAVYAAARDFADTAPDMVWRLYCLASQRAARTRAREPDPHWSRDEAGEQLTLADEAERMMVEGVMATPHPAPSTRGARSGDVIFRWDFQAFAFHLPIPPMLRPATRSALLDNAASSIDWALTTFSKDGQRSDSPYEWLFEFGGWLGRLIGHLTPAELLSLLLSRLDAAERTAAAEVMDVVMQRFMIDWMLVKEPLDQRLIDNWEAMVDWAIARPSWSTAPSDAGQYDRGMGLSALFSGVVMSRGVICGVEPDWPNIDRLLPAIQRAVERFSGERTVFAALVKLLRAKFDRLMPRPGLEWILAVIRLRRTVRDFWAHASNGEQLVILMRDLIAAGPLATNDRAAIVEIANSLIEVGVRGAAFLQQDMVRLKR